MSQIIIDLIADDALYDDGDINYALDYGNFWGKKNTVFFFDKLS